MDVQDFLLNVLVKAHEAGLLDEYILLDRKHYEMLVQGLMDEEREIKVNKLKYAYWDHRYNSWTSQVKLDRRKYHLGQFETEQEAHNVAVAFLEARKQGKVSSLLTERKRRLSFAKAEKIRADFRKGAKVEDLAKEFGVAYETVRDVITNRTWVRSNEVV